MAWVRWMSSMPSGPVPAPLADLPQIESVCFGHPKYARMHSIFDLDYLQSKLCPLIESRRGIKFVIIISQIAMTAQKQPISSLLCKSEHFIKYYQFVQCRDVCTHGR